MPGSGRPGTDRPGARIVSSGSVLSSSTSPTSVGSTAAVLRAVSRPLVTVASAATMSVRPARGMFVTSAAVARPVIGGVAARVPTGAGSIGRSAADPIATPEQRWRAAVAARPLEAPRPFPAALRPLVTRFAGAADRASYTTGAATRHALSEAGAHGATTGSVVHLADPPHPAALRRDAAALRVLAHELTHARQPVGRPRFLLRAPSGSADADERTARAVGEHAHAAYATVARDAIEGVTGGVFGTGVGRDSGRAGGPGAFGPGAVIGAGVAPASFGTAGSATVARSVASGSATGTASGRSPVRDTFHETAGAVSAGVVDRLPVGGAAVGAVGGAVGGSVGGVRGGEPRSAPGSATEATESPASLAGDVSQNRAVADDETARTLLAALSGAAGPVASASGALGAADSTSAAGTGVLAEASHAATAADGAVSVAGQAGRSSTAGGTEHAGASGHEADLDRIVEALEQRLLRQIERRGGRYAGVF